MSEVLAAVAQALGGSRRIGRLLIMAHGMSISKTSDALVGVLLGRDLIHAGFRSWGEQDIDEEYGPNIIQAGYHTETLSPWGRFKGRIDEIRFLSCGAASKVAELTDNVEPDMTGFEMCGRFAVRTGAYVMAAEQKQMFTFGYRPWGGLASAPKSREAWNYEGSVPTNFGLWEGPVHVFSPFSGSVVASSSNGLDPVYKRED
jgi:hypothetical protein